jgi:hypothetical protein
MYRTSLLQRESCETIDEAINQSINGLSLRHRCGQWSDVAIAARGPVGAEWSPCDGLRHCITVQRDGMTGKQLARASCARPVAGRG